jgi:hypothetical protein
MVFVPGYSADSGLIIKQARENGLVAPILGGDGWGQAMYDIAGSALDGNFYSGHWNKDKNERDSGLRKNRHAISIYVYTPVNRIPGLNYLNRNEQETSCESVIKA